MSRPHTLTGSCLCGGVRFTIDPPFRDVIVCHCRQCAKWSGHQVAATAVAPQSFIITDGEALVGWYHASETAARGFCTKCGSSLFWKPEHGRHISVMAGVLDQPTELTVGAHIFCDDQADYERTSGAAPRFGGGDQSQQMPAAQVMPMTGEI